MAEILDECAESIRIEPPGPDGVGVEFWLRKKGFKEYHQVKRQQGQRHYWSVSNLATIGVLESFQDKLRSQDAVCVFVSMNSSEIAELCERAKDANTFAEFRDFFATDQQSLERLHLLTQNLGFSEEDGYRYLKRIRSETISEAILRTITESRLASLVEGNPATALDILAQFALDNVHHELTGLDLWNHLESRGYSRCNWGKDAHVLAAVEASNSRYLTGILDEAVLGQMIVRDEATKALEILTGKAGVSGVMFEGESGVGKSTVIYQTIKPLQEKGWPILAFRVDRLDASQLPDLVGEQLGLPGSPTNVLAAIAQGRDCALVIDQLDAVSLASGRHPAFFDCLREIIDQSRAHPNIHIILAARRFDLDNDHRLQKLKDQNADSAITITRLSYDTVKKVIAEMGLRPDHLSTKQLDLLSLPLHLKLLAEGTEASTGEALDFQTVNDLYTKFCWRKQVLISEAIGRPVAWREVTGAMSDYMSVHQVLSVPKFIVEERSSFEDANALASWHVLIDDGKQYAFFHEGFFDYVFARRFVAAGRRLVDLLNSGEQHLFRRAQIRQILIHLREAACATYLADLRFVLTSSQVRFHVKDTVVALLSTLPDPKQEEWETIAPGLLDLSTPLAMKLWRVLSNSAAWVRLVDSMGVIKGWLTDENDKLVDQAVVILAGAQQYIPDRVAELTEPYIRTGGLWNERFSYLMERARLPKGGLEQSRRFFDLFLTLIAEGVLDGLAGGLANDFWGLLYAFSKSRPQWCGEALGHYFARRLEVSLSLGQTNPFDPNARTIPHAQLAKQIMSECVRTAPNEFVQSVLPFVISVIEHNATIEGLPPWDDRIWFIRYKEHVYDIDQVLLEALNNALFSIARNDPDGFSVIAERVKGLGFETIQYLLIHAYSANGARFADEATDYLLESPARLCSGHSGDSHSGTCELLSAITPFCSDKKLRRIEETVLSYYPDWERTASGRRAHGYAQFRLLQSIDLSRMSKEAGKRLQEWQRKFNRPRTQTAGDITGGAVPSPIPESAAARMTDDQWRKAIEHYDYDWNDTRPERAFLGGAVELSRLLEMEVRMAPARFAELCLRIPDTANPTYFAHILRGISGTKLDTATVLRICEHCHRLPNRPCGREICEALSKLSDSNLPPTAVEMLAWYGLRDPDPEHELWRRNDTNETPYYGGNVSTAGLNSVRGGAAYAIGTLIFDDVNRAEQLLPVVTDMTSDKSIAVRSWVINALIGLLNYDRDIAVDLFKRACEIEDALLGTEQVERFLSYALHTHYEQLKPVLERMLASPLASVATVAARRACLAGLLNEDASPIALACISGTEAQREGAAQIFAANLQLESTKALCTSALIAFFNDSSDEVRKWASTCFHHLGSDQLLEHIDLIDAFVESTAFPSQHSALVEALIKSVSNLPDITLRVCERTIEVIGEDSADIRTRGPIDSEQVSRLLIRLYSQSSDPVLQSRSLDLIDRMMELGCYGLLEAIESFER